MSQTPQNKPTSTTNQKMCKSPKNSTISNNYHHHHHQKQPHNNLILDKIEYENLSTNCTVVGSNNLNLVKKQQQQQQNQASGMSPAYSNPSPGGGSGCYPPSSPYSSPASLKSPSPSLKPPTPTNFPVMQIIHNNHPLLARPMQSGPNNQQSQNIIKLKPHLNILPKPAAASPQQSPKPSVSPQIVIPNQPTATATLMPTAQPLLINQMPMITTQFIIRPQTTTKLPTQMQTATPQGLILQSSGGQPLLQLQPPRSQPMVRVLTNGMQLAPSTTTYVTQMATSQQPVQQQQQAIINHNNHHVTVAAPVVKKRTKTKVKKKLDLANIMKLSGIGDEDDIQFESDTSQQSESDHNSVPNVITTMPQSPHATLLQQQQHHHQNADNSMAKKLGNIQISAMPQTINATTATPVVQVLNHQNFQSAASQNAAQAQAAAGIPFNSFIAPNFTINNGLMLQQRSSGGFKLTMGEDGRLVLQHDPTMNQDLQSQLFFQGLLGLNTGGLVLQPSSIDQQTVQQTVQTIQQQSVQTIQQQTVQSQTIQTVQQQTVPAQTLQTLQPQIQQQTVQQTIQHQTVQSQPLTALQQPMQIVQPQPASVHSIQSQVHSLSQIQNLLQQQQQQHQQPQQNFQQHHHHHHHHHHSQPVLKVQPFQKTQHPPVQPVQPIQSVHHHQQQQQQQQENHSNGQSAPPTSYVVNLTPDQLEQLKRNGQVTVNGQTIFMQRPKEDKKLKVKGGGGAVVKKVNKSVFKEEVVVKSEHKEIIPPPSPIKAKLNHVVQKALVQPSVIPPKKVQPLKKVQPQPQLPQPDLNNGEVDKFLGQLLEDNPPPVPLQNQRITTIQLTPQKQQHLKSIQLQIQTLSARGGGDTEMQNALKLLFAEQQKILASGKLLPPDKVYYHNNQLIVNPSSLNLPPVTTTATTTATVVVGKQQELHQVPLPITTTTSTTTTTTTQTHPIPRISVSLVAPTPTVPSVVPSVSSSVEHATQTPPTLLHNNNNSNNLVAATVAAPVTHNQRLSVGAAAAACSSVGTVTPQKQQQSIVKKAQLVETQLNLDQNGAVKPDMETPFRDKKDACVRLIRYHCMDQPVLSQKDLNKADEIFELTARHFIGKYAKMVDKYKFLLMKESMRHVQTSELMMLDRLFLNEEQASLTQLRDELETARLLQQEEDLAVQQLDQNSEVYDEWACIQRELGCLPAHTPDEKPSNIVAPSTHPNPPPPQIATAPSTKRSASTDSRLETLKRFRVDKHSKKCLDVQGIEGATAVTGQSHNNLSYGSHEETEPENNSIDEQVQSAIDSILNLQQSTTTSAGLDLDSILS